MKSKLAIRGKSLAIFGIVTYVVSILSCIENTQGEVFAPTAILGIASIMSLTFLVMASVRLWKEQKWGPIWLVTSSVLLVVLSLVGGVPTLLVNIIRIISVLVWVWVIFLLFVVERLEQNVPLSKGEMPEIGKHLHWLKIVNHALRVLDLDRSGTTVDEDGQVKAKLPSRPYGYLIVESPILDSHVRLPIIHCDDFRLADMLVDKIRAEGDQRGVELLVCYSPEILMPNGFSGSPWHCLHFVAKPEGALDEYYSMNGGVHLESPEPQTVFDPFVYRS